MYALSLSLSPTALTQTILVVLRLHLLSTIFTFYDNRFGHFYPQGTASGTTIISIPQSNSTSQTSIIDFYFNCFPIFISNANKFQQCSVTKYVTPDGHTLYDVGCTGSSVSTTHEHAILNAIPYQLTKVLIS